MIIHIIISVLFQEWNHFCIAYSALSRRVVIMHNGHLEVDHTRPEMVKEVKIYC